MYYKTHKVFLFIFTILIFFVFTITPVFANPLDGHKEEEINNEDIVDKINPIEELLQGIIESKGQVGTGEFLVTFTQPLGNNIMYDTQCFICGFKIPENEEEPKKDNILQNANPENSGANSEKEDEKIEDDDVTIVILARFNDKTGKYEECKNSEGESRWGIGSFGFFTKAIELIKGINKLKVTILKIPAKLYKVIIGSEIEEIENMGNMENLASQIPNSENMEDYIEIGIKTEEKKISEETEEAKNEGETESDKTETLIEEEILFKLGENLQVTYFTINALNKKTKNELINKPARVDDVIIDMIPN